MRKLFSQECIFLLGLYLWGLGVLWYAHDLRVTRDPGLIGEELSVAFRNVGCLPARWQADSYATNFSASIFYWVGSYLLPLTVNSQRVFKILFLAFLPVLISVFISRLKPGCSLLARGFGGVIFSLLPNIVWYSIMSTEYVVDCVFSFSLLLLVFAFVANRKLLRRNVSWILFVSLSIFVLHFYADSLPVLGVSWIIVCILLLKEAKESNYLLSIKYILPTFLLAFWPAVFFKNKSLIMFSGGGELDLSWSALSEIIKINFNDLFLKPDSYLSSGEMPFSAFQWDRGGVLLVFLAILGIMSLLRNKYACWLMLVAVLSFVVSIISGTAAPGIRRMMPFVIVFCVFVGVGIENLLLLTQKEIRRSFWIIITVVIGLCGSFWPMLLDPQKVVSIETILGFIVFILITTELIYQKFSVKSFIVLNLVLFLILPLNSFLQSFNYVKEHYVAWLQRDFQPLEGQGYIETIDHWSQAIAEGEVEFDENRYSWDYIVASKLICERRYSDCHRVKIKNKEEEDVACL